MKTCIVNFANNTERYTKGQMRLIESLENVGYNGNMLMATSYHDINECPPHEVIPYAFKPYAIKQAVDMGYELILWCDSVIYAKKPLNDIFKYIEANGYLFFKNIGFSIGDFTSDACLKRWGLERERAFEIPMIMACCMGFNLKNKKAKQFLDMYYQAAQDGTSFFGDWTNEKKQVSEDNRVKGHRHDQSVASILIELLEMDMLIGHETYFTYEGHEGMQPVADSVCLFSK